MSARYELLHLLGRGGMGSVYAATHYPSGRDLAVKIPFEAIGTSAARRALLREATAAARLRHPNIVRLHDVVRMKDGRLALVMELVDGQNLLSFTREWPGWSLLIDVILGVVDGLGAAHAAGIVHRDLKLENVLVSGEGHAKITDFGIAADIDVRSQTNQEVDRMPGGTPLYMAPEQFSSVGVIGPWTDLYALGVMLHVLFTGESPFDDSTLPRLLLAKHEGKLRDCLDTTPLPDELVRLIRMLLHSDPRRRPRFAREVRSIVARLRRDLPPPRGAVTLAPGVETSSSAPTRVSPKAPTAAMAVDPTPSSRRRRIGAAPTEPSSRSHATLTMPSSADGTIPTTPYVSDGSEPAVITLRMSDEPTSLPAPLDPDLGVSVARLRDPEIVGRSAELEMIREAVMRVTAAGRPELFGIVGASGVGKSTIARWGVALVEAEGLMEPLATAFDAFASDAAGGVRYAIGRLLGDVGSIDVEQGWPAAWAWLGSPENPPFDARRVIAWIKADPATVTSDESASVAFEVLRAAAKVRPVYLWLDDLGWSQDGAIELAEKILADGCSAILMVATFRSGTLEHSTVRQATERLLGFPTVTMRELGTLGFDERAALIRAIAPVRLATAHALAAALHESTLVTIELVHDWIAAGILQPTADGFSTESSVESLLEARPPHVALSNRVETLLGAFGSDAELAERVLTRAALLGVVFDEHLLSSACSSFDGDGKVVHEVIDRSLLSGILRPEGQVGYRFDHDAIREALVVRLERRPDRAAVMEETVAWMLKRIGYTRPDVLIRVATLLHESDRNSLRAWEVLLDASGVLARNSEFSGTDRLLAIATRWLEEDRVPDLDWRRAKLQHAKGRAAFFASRYDLAEPALHEAERICDGIGDTLLQNRCVLLRAQLLFYHDRLAESERIVKQLLARAGNGDPRNARQVTVCNHLLGEFAALRGEHAEALEHTLRARTSAAQIGEPTQERMQEIQLIERLLMLGRTDDADTQLNKCLEMIEATADVGTSPHAFEAHYRVLASKGEWSKIRAIGISRRATELEELGDPWRLTSLRLIESLVSLNLDDDEAATAAAERFVVAFERSSHDEAYTRKAMRALAFGLQARGLRSIGDRVRALSTARDEAIARGFAG